MSPQKTSCPTGFGRVKWLHLFPDSWEKLPSKRLFRQSKQKASVEDEQLTASQDYGVILQKEFVKLAGRSVVQLNQHQDKRKRVELDDFVISMRSFQGGLERAFAEGGIRSSYVVLKPSKKVHVGYFSKLFKSSEYIQALQATSHFIRDGQDLNFGNFCLVDLPLPPWDLQEKIDSFIDIETAKIDTMIGKQQQLINFLKEKRQAVISHAVTQGVNPKVTKHDSGVDCLGKVPEHWINTKIKYIAELTPKKSEVEKEQYKTCSFIPMEKLKTDVLTLDEVCPIRSVFDGYTYFREEDVLIAKVTPCFENRNMVVARGLKNGIGFGSSEIYVLRAKLHQLNDFLCYRLQEDVFVELATGAMTGAGGLKRVPSEFIKNFKIALPPENERFEIVNYIKKYISEFDPLIYKALNAIKLMRERRSTLISAAVTGNIDVRNFIVNEDDIKTN